MLQTTRKRRNNNERGMCGRRGDGNRITQQTTARRWGRMRITLQARACLLPSPPVTKATSATEHFQTSARQDLARTGLALAKSKKRQLYSWPRADATSQGVWAIRRRSTTGCPPLYPSAGLASAGVLSIDWQDVSVLAARHMPGLWRTCPACCSRIQAGSPQELAGYQWC